MGRDPCWEGPKSEGGTCRGGYPAWGGKPTWRETPHESDPPWKGPAWRGTHMERGHIWGRKLDWLENHMGKDAARKGGPTWEKVPYGKTPYVGLGTRCEGTRYTQVKALDIPASKGTSHGKGT